MRNWIKKIIRLKKDNYTETLWYDLYHYTLKPQIISLLELRENTWDKQRVDRIIDALCYINLDEFSKDYDLRGYIQEIREKD
jgi:hypothetical protein